MEQIRLSFGGADIVLQTDDQDVLRQVRLDFGALIAGQTCSGQPNQTIAVQKARGPLCEGELVPSGAMMALRDPVLRLTEWQWESRQLLLWRDRCAVIRDTDTGRTEVIARPGWPAYPVVRSEVVQSLRRALNRSGNWVLHAGVACDGNSRFAVLIPASKGAGKTSACLLLARAGLQVLTDELAVLTDPQALACTGIPRRFGLTPGTVERFFPECERLPRDRFISPVDGREKWLFRPVRLAESRWSARPLSVVLVPTIRHSAEAEVGPLSLEEARNSLYAALATNDSPPGELYAFAGEMAARLPAFQLVMGWETDGNVAALRRWIAGLTAERRGEM